MQSMIAIDKETGEEIEVKESSVGDFLDLIPRDQHEQFIAHAKKHYRTKAGYVCRTKDDPENVTYLDAYTFEAHYNLQD